MATTIKLKNSVTTTNAPSSLVQGEVAINITDKKVWVGNAATTPIQLLGDGGSVNFTTVDTTNLQVTNIKAKDGTASASIANSTGAFTVAAAFAANGGATLGDASGDALTINSSAVSIPNGLNFDSNTLVIDAANNRVGIGTSSPSEPLTVQANASGYAFTLLGRAAGEQAQWFAFSNNAGTVQAAMYATSNNLIFANTSSYTERMRIDSSGNVLVGTTATIGTSKFVVAGVNNNTSPVVQGAASSGAYIYFYNNAQTTGGIQLGQGAASGSDNVGYLYNNANAAFTFGTNGTERMRITSGGLLLVNSTSTVLGSQHNITGGTNAGLGVMTLQNASNTTYSHSIGANSSGAFIIYRTSDNAGVYLSWGGTSWTANSDERLKTDLKPITDAVNKILTLRTVTGRYKTDEEGTSRAFLIAQDVQKVLPEAINEQSNEEKTLGLSYTDTIPLLVAAIQEQQAMIEELKQEVAALKAK